MANYEGGCHCGEISFTVEMDIKEVMSCNCSICSKRGSLLAFNPAENFTLIKGEYHLTDYQFNKKTIHHLFCKKCGILSFGKATMPDGTKMVAINVRCLNNIDIDQFPIKKFDGKSM
ncbi:MAG: GFA family protein [Thermodesulfobacteriota bacterium]